MFSGSSNFSFFNSEANPLTAGNTSADEAFNTNTTWGIVAIAGISVVGFLLCYYSCSRLNRGDGDPRRPVLTSGNTSTFSAEDEIRRTFEHGTTGPEPTEGPYHHEGRRSHYW